MMYENLLKMMYSTEETPTLYEVISKTKLFILQGDILRAICNESLEKLRTDVYDNDYEYTVLATIDSMMFAYGALEFDSKTRGDIAKELYTMFNSKYLYRKLYTNDLEEFAYRLISVTNENCIYYNKLLYDYMKPLEYEKGMYAKITVNDEKVSDTEYSQTINKSGSNTYTETGTSSKSENDSESKTSETSNTTNSKVYDLPNSHPSQNYLSGEQNQTTNADNTDTTTKTLTGSISNSETNSNEYTDSNTNAYTNKFDTTESSTKEIIGNVDVLTQRKRYLEYIRNIYKEIVNLYDDLFMKAY